LHAAVPAGDQNSGVIFDDASDETLPIAARRIEFERPAQAVEAQFLSEIFPVVRSETSCGD
jgi:hypothetical protein